MKPPIRSNGSGASRWEGEGKNQAITSIAVATAGTDDAWLAVRAMTTGPKRKEDMTVINTTRAEPWREGWEMGAILSGERGWEERGEVAMVRPRCCAGKLRQEQH
jgi:hypothetical protein